MKLRRNRFFPTWGFFVPHVEILNFLRGCRLVTPVVLVLLVTLVLLGTNL